MELTGATVHNPGDKTFASLPPAREIEVSAGRERAARSDRFDP